MRWSSSGRACAVLVFPVRGNTFFRDTVHLVGADLHLEGLAIVNHRGVQGLIQVRAGHGDVIFEPPWHGPPDLVHHAERGVTIALGIGDDAHGE